MNIFVCPICFIPLYPLYPLSPANLSTFLPVILWVCSNVFSIVCSSYSFLKEHAPRISPDHERRIDTLLPNSYCLCSLPLLMQTTSGSCREYTLSLTSYSEKELCNIAQTFSPYPFFPSRLRSSSLTNLPAMVLSCRNLP